MSINFPMEDIANWLVSAASGGEGELPFNRAIHGVLDPMGLLAPDSLHGFRDKTRLKITLGRLVEIPGLARCLDIALFPARLAARYADSPDARLSGRAVVGFADDFGQGARCGDAGLAGDDAGTSVRRRTGGLKRLSASSRCRRGGIVGAARRTGIAGSFPVAANGMLPARSVVRRLQPHRRSTWPDPMRRSATIKR